jgi:peptidoglycan/xylan/chitin deacetylase (PgdA/CDA1 family)
MGAILCFHSLTTPDLPGEGDAHVPLTFFKNAVRIARHLGRIVPLEDLVRRHREGRSTSRLIAITFDDAYASLSGELARFIARDAVPVTVFVAAGAAARGAVFWWDRVDDAFGRAAPARWRAFEDACGLPEAYRTGQPAEYGPLRPLRQWILARHAGRWPADLEPALDELEADAGVRTRHRAMTFDELAALATLPSVSLGVHTVSHPVLPLLADDDLRREIADCHSTLRDRFGRVAPLLAVPFALYDRRTVEIARAAGMLSSFSLEGTTVTDRHESAVLPRICVTRRDTLPRLAFRMAGLRDAWTRLGRRQVPAYPDLPSEIT